MVSKIQTVELQLNANVVIVNDQVDLTANLSDLELEQIEDQGGEIWFVVDGDETDEIDRKRDQAADGNLEGGRKPGEYRAKVELRLPPTRSRARSATRESTSSEG